MKFLRRKTAIIAVVATALALGGCTGAESPGPASKSLTIGVNQEALSFNPAKLQSSPGGAVQFWAPLYDTLLARDPRGSVVPNMTAWKYNEAHTALTLTLREDLRFADGKPIRATNVVESLKAFRSGSAADAVYLAGVSDIAAKDDRTVVLTLAEPDPSLLYKLTSTSGVVSNATGFHGDYPEASAVSGAYTLNREQSQPGVQFVYDRNDTYWNHDAWPYKHITVKTLQDGTARTNALLSGQIDVAVIDPQSAKAVEAKGFKLTVQSSAWEGMYIFDRDGALVPALADVRVRRAMNMAFDRESIAKNLFLGFADPASQIFREGASAAHYDGHDYSYDVAGARKLMAEAGYAHGFTLRMPSVSTFNNWDATVVDSLAKIGITVKVEPLPQDQFVSRQLHGEYPIGMTRYSQDTPWIDFARHILPDSPWNPMHTSSPELKALLHDVQFAPDDKSREKAENAVGAYVFDNAWFIPLINAPQVIAHKSDMAVQTQVGLNLLPLQNYSPQQ